MNDCKKDQTEMRRHALSEQSYNSTNCKKEGFAESNTGGLLKPFKNGFSFP